MNIIQKYRSLPKEKRSELNTYLAISFGLLWSIIKLVIGLVNQSRFLIASALFTFCLSISKLLCIVGIIKYDEKYVKLLHISSSLLIFLSGTFYGLYNARLMFGEMATNYGLIPSLAIASVSFFLWIKAIVFLFKDRKHDDYHRNLRIISFISGCMDIVLTQMCLLAVEIPDMNPRYNLYLALGIATLTAVLGIYCLIKPFIKRS